MEITVNGKSSARGELRPSLLRIVDKRRNQPGGKEDTGGRATKKTPKRRLKGYGKDIAFVGARTNQKSSATITTKIMRGGVGGRVRGVCGVGTRGG